MAVDVIDRIALDKRRRLGLRQCRRWGKHVSPEAVGKAGTTRCPCSCWMCGNKRRAYGPTRQEMRAMVADE